MFKTYMNKYYSDSTNYRKAAYELASLFGHRFVVFKSTKEDYYVWDGFKWFDVQTREYVHPDSSAEVDADFLPVQPETLKSVSMRKFSVNIGSRKAVPIYNFEQGTINFIGVLFDDLGGIIKVNDGGRFRAFSYGVRGSEFYFEEL